MKQLLTARFRSLLLIALSVGIVAGASAESPHAQDDMRERYDRAAFIENNVANRYYLNRMVMPTWFDDGNRFWYRRETRDGYRFTAVEAASGQKAPLFDHEKLAAALQSASEKKISPDSLPLRHVHVRPDGTVDFVAFDKAYSFGRKGKLVMNGPANDLAGQVVAPNKQKSVFLRGFNLWMRDLESGDEQQLTDDGSQTYAYAMLPEAARQISSTEATWSPKSQKILTFQVDDRQVKELPIIQFAPEGSVRPVASSYRVAFPGDEHVPMFRMTIVDAESGKQTRVHYPDIPAVRMLDTPIGGGRAWWSADGQTAYFVEITRGEKTARLIAVDASTGETRKVFEENTEEGYLELGQMVYTSTALAPLPQRNQLIWYSERTGQAHLYLYDLSTGEMVRPLTSGDFIVRDLLHVDEARHEMILSIAGRDAAKNPYHQEIVRINLDNGSMTILSAGDSDRQVIGPAAFEKLIEQGVYGADPKAIRGVSPNGKFIVETQTRIDMPSQTVLKRSSDGGVIGLIEQSVVADLPAGFEWPRSEMLVAADGKTPIRAIVARPSDFDPTMIYPVIDHIYGGPQVFNAPTSFAMSAVQAQALAELGFIVVVIDGRGTSGRDRAFHEASYGAAETASDLEDHVAGIRQLAARYRYMDISRVGIYGFSGGGYMTASAMLRYPDFFDVGVAAAGNHDQRLFWHSWGERYQGLVDGENYLTQANVTYADQLKGDLLLIHGMMDVGVHPGQVFQLAQALMDANKDFDMLLFPRASHQLPGYGQRRMWDYFVEKLAGKTPPPNYKLISSNESFLEVMDALMVGEPIKNENKD